MARIVKYKCGTHPSTGKFYELTIIETDGALKSFCLIRRYGKASLTHRGGTVMVEIGSEFAFQELLNEKQKKGYIFGELTLTPAQFFVGSSYSAEHIQSHYRDCTGGAAELRARFPLGGAPSPVAPAPTPAPVRQTPVIEGWGEW